MISYPEFPQSAPWTRWFVTVKCHILMQLLPHSLPLPLQQSSPIQHSWKTNQPSSDKRLELSHPDLLPSCCRYCRVQVGRNGAKRGAGGDPGPGKPSPPVDMSLLSVCSPPPPAGHTTSSAFWLDCNAEMFWAAWSSKLKMVTQMPEFFPFYQS